MMTKNSLLLFLSLLLIYGCSSSTESNENTNTTVIPIAPTNLIGTVASTSQINLSWIDNSTNEIGFKIERKIGAGTFAIVGTTAPNTLTFSDVDLTPNTTYTYKVYSFNSIGNSSSNSNELSLTTNSIINLPILNTTAVSFIAFTTGISGGTISSDGGASITARGVCWSTNTNPTIALSTKTTNGTGAGVFTSPVSGLTPNTAYYIRSYATNSFGTAYGNELSFTTTYTSDTSVTDIDGNTYPLVIICNQAWTGTNLNVTKYRNGDVIPQVTNVNAWENLTTGAWCYSNNDSANGIIYGKLYNWYAVNDPRGLAPEGYHIPSYEEWNNLTTCLGGEPVAGGKMKETGTTHWSSPNTNATNSSNFTGLPGGVRSFSGVFSYFSIYGYWWSSSEYNTGIALYQILSYGNSVSSYGYEGKSYGFSVRCLKD